MTEKDQSAVPRLPGAGLPERLGADDYFAAGEDRPADFAAGLVGLGFIRAALRRSAGWWCGTAVAGLLIGCAFYLASPPTYQASASVLLTLGPGEDVNTTAADAQAIVQSDTVAGLAVRKLGLRESANSFLGKYTATVVSSRVLHITVTAPSSGQAVRSANAVASEFLQLRAEQLTNAESLTLQSLDQQIGHVRQNIKSISAQISQVSGQPASRAQQSQLSDLQTERTEAATTLTSLEQSVIGNQQTVEPAVMAAAKGSRVLDAGTPLPHSRLKRLLLYTAVGLVVGLFLSMAIVVVRALVSDRLRRRDDVADALGAPVKLSVGAVRRYQLLPPRRGLAAAGRAGVRRIAAHLGRSVPEDAPGPAALAVVPVGDPRVAALSLASLAVYCAQQGRQVLLADLARGAPAARLFGVRGPGSRAVSADGARLTVAVPERDEMTPAGPLGRGPASAGDTSFTSAVAAASSSADLLLTLASLDPAVGGDHLCSWAADAVVVVAAGRSSWTRINAVGEMIRLSGTRLVSAVLTGADNADESLGVAYQRQAGEDAGAMERDLRPASGFISAASNSQGRHRPRPAIHNVD